MEKDPDSEQSPVTYIAVSGLSNEDRAIACRIVTNNCGVYETTLSHSTTLLVTDRVGGGKYMSAVGVYGIPVVSFEYLLESEKQGRFIDYRKFALPALRGLKICVTGGLGRKEEFERVVLENGGKHVHFMTSDCTHLIVGEDGFGKEKHVYADKWKIKTVCPEWLHACVDIGAFQSEEGYPAVAPKPLKRSESAPAALGISRRTSLNSQSGDDRSKSSLGGRNSTNETFANFFLAEKNVWTEYRRTHEPHSSLFNCVVFISPCKEALLGAGFNAVATKTTTTTNSNKALTTPANKIDIRWKVLREAALFSGATTCWDFDASRATHIVVAGTEFEESTTIAKNLKRKVIVVNANFLLDCAIKRVHCKENEYAFESGKPLYSRLLAANSTSQDDEGDSADDFPSQPSQDNFTDCGSNEARGRGTIHSISQNVDTAREDSNSLHGEKVICVTQYEGSERQEVKRLCQQLGAKFVERFDSNVHYLIAKDDAGAKVNEAKKMGVAIETLEWLRKRDAERRESKIRRGGGKESEAKKIV